MSFEKAKAYLEAKGYVSHIMIPDQCSGTVEEAAAALGVQPCEIAKTISLLVHEKVILIVCEGNAKMIPFDEVEALVGHAPGGVCPFGINEGIEVYLDESLKKFKTVYPACGNSQSAVKMSLEELEDASNYVSWVDVCKE